MRERERARECERERLREHMREFEAYKKHQKNRGIRRGGPGEEL